MQLHQQHCSDVPDAVQKELDEIDLAFVSEDLEKTLQSMQSGTARIRDIVRSLRNFSRLDESDLKAVDLNEGLENTLLIVQHRLSDQTIEMIRDYEILPQVQCYAGQLNQAFMNIINNSINNSIDALEQVAEPKIWITITADVEWSQISIRDNGCGISDEVRSQIFNPFFTTKEVVRGTGLGLAISYQVIIDRHNGQITCESTSGEGTTFAIKIPVRAIHE